MVNYKKGQAFNHMVGVLDVAKRSPKGEQPGGGCESKRRFAGGGSFREVGAGGTIFKQRNNFLCNLYDHVHMRGFFAVAFSFDVVCNIPPL